MVDIPKYLEEIFSNLHSMPELAFEETRTSAFISSELEKNGFTVKSHVAGTGILACLESANPGPAFAIRADIDALSFHDGYRSFNFHGCGHDANAAMVLGLSKLVSVNRITNGRLYLLFQPAEESLKGALAVINSGALPHIDEMVGIHLRPIEEAPLGMATPELLHGASSKVFVHIKGKSTHGARPHLGINTIDSGVTAINAMRTLFFNPVIPHTMIVTDFHGGNGVYNLVPSHSQFTVDLRSGTNELMATMKEQVQKVLTRSISINGGVPDISFDEGSPAAEYDPDTVEVVKHAITRVLGKAQNTITTPGSEDFHYYSTLAGIKTAYIGLGANLKPGLHSNELSFDHEALVHGVRVLEAVVEARLGCKYS